jgi:hypothetical protein
MTTPKQPAPARPAERYAAEAILNRNADPDDDAAIVARALLRVEAEAAAGVLALREALTEAAKMRHEYGKGIASGHDVTWETCFVPICAKYRELLRDTAPAAAAIEARIEQRGIDKGIEMAHEWRLDELHEAEDRIGHAVGDWLASPEAEQRLAKAMFGGFGPRHPEERERLRVILAAFREQPATDALTPRGYRHYDGGVPAPDEVEQPATEEAE